MGSKKSKKQKRSLKAPTPWRRKFPLVLMVFICATIAGATLGGLWRLRGYPSQRFSDKAAIYYAAEMRFIPRWNPFDGWSWLQKYLGVQWLQFVPFVEIGRVAPVWSVERLHESMKWDAGLGVRFWARGLVARIDSAVSDEGYHVQMMVSQPFQF